MRTPGRTQTEPECERQSVPKQCLNTNPWGTLGPLQTVPECARQGIPKQCLNAVTHFLVVYKFSKLFKMVEKLVFFYFNLIMSPSKCIHIIF